MRMGISRTFQETLLYHLIYTADANQLAALTDTDIFDDKQARLADKVLAYWHKYRKPPGTALHDIAADLFAGDSTYHSLLASIRAQADVPLDYVRERLASWVRTRRLKAAAIQALELLDAGDHLEAQSRLIEAVRDTAAAGLDDIGLRLDSPQVASLLLTHDEARAEDTLQTGIAPLDKRRLGPARKQLHLFIAPPKHGKSWWLCHLAKRAVMQHWRVVYVTLELSSEVICRRLAQCLFAFATSDLGDIPVPAVQCDEMGRVIMVDRRWLRRPGIGADGWADWLRQKLKQWRGRLPVVVKEFPTGGLSVTQLEAYLDILEGHGFKPSLLILDYADLLHISRSDYRIGLGEAYKQLRGVAVDRDIALATASQANRLALKSRVVREMHVAEDFSKIATADTVITYSRTPQERELGLARLTVTNSRTEADGTTIAVAQCYPLGQFCLGAGVLTDNYWQAVQHHADDSQQTSDS